MVDSLPFWSPAEIVVGTRCPKVTLAEVANYQSEGAKFGLYAAVPSQFNKTDGFHFTQIATNVAFGAGPKYLGANYL